MDYEVTQAGDAWDVYVPVVDRHTQARHLGEVEEMAADLVEAMGLSASE